MIWLKVGKILGERVPACIQKILSSCGYYNLTSLGNISQENIVEIEEQVNGYRNVIQELDCCFQDFYKNQDKFQFLPGHSSFIMTMSKHVSSYIKQRNEHGQREDHYSNHDSNFIELCMQYPGFSVIMKELINSAFHIQSTTINNVRYSDNIVFFFTYIFILCGRSCYEILQQNLPIPSIDTIRK